jgi:hypothetical protein
MQIRESRGPSLNMQKIAEKVGGLYLITPAASALARQIRRKNHHSDQYHHKFPCVTALQMIERGEVK